MSYLTFSQVISQSQTAQVVIFWNPMIIKWKTQFCLSKTSALMIEANINALDAMTPMSMPATVRLVMYHLFVLRVSSRCFISFLIIYGNCFFLLHRQTRRLVAFPGYLRRSSDPLCDHSYLRKATQQEWNGRKRYRSTRSVSFVERTATVIPATIKTTHLHTYKYKQTCRWDECYKTLSN